MKPLRARAKLYFPQKRLAMQLQFSHINFGEDKKRGFSFKKDRGKESETNEIEGSKIVSARF